LVIQHDVVVGEVIRHHNAIPISQFRRACEIVHDPLGIDCRVDHNVGHVNVVWTQFPRHALGQCSEAVLGTGEGGEPRRPAYAGGGTGKDDCAASAFRHVAGRLPTRKESGEAGHLPDFEEFAAVGVEDAHGHVGADIEYHRVDFPDVLFYGGEAFDNLVFLAGVTAEAVGREALVAQFLDQWHEFFPVAPERADGETPRRELAGNGATDGVTGADDDGYLTAHGLPSGRGNLRRQARSKVEPILVLGRNRSSYPRREP
jgi:hypothetical protein